MYIEITKEEKEHNLLETVACITIKVFDNSMPLDEYGNETGPSNYEMFCAKYPKHKNGFIEQVNVCIDWAKEFECINDGRLWDGEWYDELYAFIANYLWFCWYYQRYANNDHREHQSKSIAINNTTIQ